MGLKNYYFDPNPNSYKVSPAKFGVNLGFTAYGLLGGPLGFGISTGYFILDQMGAFEGPDFSNGGNYIKYNLAPADALKFNLSH